MDERRHRDQDEAIKPGVCRFDPIGNNLDKVARRLWKLWTDRYSVVLFVTWAWDALLDIHEKTPSTGEDVHYGEHGTTKTMVHRFFTE